MINLINTERFVMGKKLGKSDKPEKEDRKARLVQSAIKCFAKKGVAQTTMREIAQKAKVDQPLMHYYFKTTDELYVDVIRVVLEGIKSASVQNQERTQDPLKRLREYIAGTFKWARENPEHFSIWMYFYYLSVFKPEFTKLNREIRLTGRDRIALMIHQGLEQAKFLIPPGQSVQDLALNIQGFITGNCIMVASEDGDWAHAEQMTVEGCFNWLSVK